MCEGVDQFLFSVCNHRRFKTSLVSTFIVCKRLSVMQDPAWVRRFCAQNPKNIIFLGNQKYPLPAPAPRIGTSWLVEDFREVWVWGCQEYPHPVLELLMEDLGSLSQRLPRIHPIPRIGTSHGERELGKFRSKVAKNPPPPPQWKLLDLCAGNWCVETNRCIPPRIPSS